jgi:biotin operon repressor
LNAAIVHPKAGQSFMSLNSLRQELGSGRLAASEHMPRDNGP